MTKRLLITLALIAGLQAPQAYSMNWMKKKISSFWYGKKTEHTQPVSPSMTIESVQAILPIAPTTLQTAKQTTVQVVSQENIPALQKPTQTNNKPVVDEKLKKTIECSFSTPAPHLSIPRELTINSIPRELQSNMCREVVPYVNIRELLQQQEQQKHLYTVAFLKTLQAIAQKNQEEDTPNVAIPDLLFGDNESQKTENNPTEKAYVPGEHFVEYTTPYPYYTPHEEKREIKKLLIVMNEQEKNELLRLGTINHSTNYNYSHSEHLLKILQAQKTLEQDEHNEINQLMTIGTTLAPRRLKIAKNIDVLNDEERNEIIEELKINSMNLIEELEINRLMAIEQNYDKSMTQNRYDREFPNILGQPQPKNKLSVTYKKPLYAHE